MFVYDKNKDTPFCIGSMWSLLLAAQLRVTWATFSRSRMLNMSPVIAGDQVFTWWTNGVAAPLTRATRWYNLCAGKTQSSDISRKPANATFRLRNWPEGTVWLNCSNCSLTTAHLISANSLKRLKAFLLRKKHQNTQSYFSSKCRVKTIARKIWIFPRQFQNRSISQMSSPSMLYTAPLFSNIYPVLLWFGIKVYRVIKTLRFRHSN